MTMFKLNAKQLRLSLHYFLWDTILIWICLLFYSLQSYYQTLLTPVDQQALFCLATGFTLLAWPLYLNKDPRPSHAFLLQQTLRSAIPRFFKVVSNPKRIGKEKWFDPDPENLTNILFLLVKIFFTPLILHFTFQNYQSVEGAVRAFSVTGPSSDYVINFNLFFFPLVYSALLLIDTLCFLLGYLTESDLLKNRIRSVDTTFFGWLVCLMCYPPFNSASGSFFPHGGDDFIIFWDNKWTFVARILILILYAIYTWASLALGFKASNLTNRGIVDSGPYAFVRHPAYISKNLVWFLTVLPVGSIPAILSTIGFMVVYYLRAITEERHLIQDPEYQAYCQKVKYRFIPGVY